MEVMGGKGKASITDSSMPSFLQFIKRHSFTLASRYKQRSIPMIKTATHKTQASVQGEKLRRDPISCWQILSRALQLKERCKYQFWALKQKC